jgi:hypothetical protein
MERQESKAKAHRNQRPGIAKKLASEASGKLQPKCSGPFVVIEKKPGSFCLADNEGRVLEHSWNADNHRCFYI